MVKLLVPGYVLRDIIKVYNSITMGLLEVSLVGVSNTTSRWTLTTTLFRAIKRINLSRGSRTCFYIYKRRLAIFTHFKTLDI